MSEEMEVDVGMMVTGMEQTEEGKMGLTGMEDLLKN